MFVRFPGRGGNAYSFFVHHDRALWPLLVEMPTLWPRCLVNGACHESVMKANLRQLLIDHSGLLYVCADRYWYEVQKDFFFCLRRMISNTYIYQKSFCWFVVAWKEKVNFLNTNTRTYILRIIHIAARSMYIEPIYILSICVTLAGSRVICLACVGQPAK